MKIKDMADSEVYFEDDILSESEVPKLQHEMHRRFMFCNKIKACRSNLV